MKKYRTEGKYILDKQGNPIEETNLFTWADWMENHSRVLKQNRVGDFLISTVFLGLDHNFDGGIPILYETMVFRNGDSVDTERYETKDQALEGHERFISQYVQKD